MKSPNIHFVPSTKSVVVPIKFGTVISRETGNFLIGEDGLQIARSSPSSALPLYRVALNKNLRLVNVTSQKGQEIMNRLHGV